MKFLTGSIDIGQTHKLDKLTNWTNSHIGQTHKSEKIVYEVSDRVYQHWTNSQIGQTHILDKLTKVKKLCMKLLTGSIGTGQTHKSEKNVYEKTCAFP